MRKRLTQEDRKADILSQAQRQFHLNGYSATEMEDIRKACGISRGGLYHHFANKGAILDAIVTQEVAALATALAQSDAPPIEALLEMGSSQLGRDPGILAALKTTDEKLVYLSCLDQAITSQLSPVLRARLADTLRPGVDPGHLAELFLTINAHINRRVVLGDWNAPQASGFAATALTALLPFLKDPAGLDRIIQAFLERGSGT